MRPKILIVDDDEYPRGRISLGILPEFKSLKLDDDVVHLKTYEEYKNYLDNLNSPNDIGLIILDSSLENSDHYYSYENTLPLTTSSLKSLAETISTSKMQASRLYKEMVKKIMSGSGGVQSRQNKEYFYKFLSEENTATGFTEINEGQLSISSCGGLSGKPSEVIKAILNYYNEIYPGDLEINEALKELNKETAKPNAESEGGPLPEIKVEQDEFKKTDSENTTQEIRILSDEEQRPFDLIRDRLMDRMEKEAKEKKEKELKIPAEPISQK